MLPLLPAVLIVNWQVFRRLVPSHVADAPASNDRLGPTTIARYVAADYSASMLWRATLNALPLLGLWLAGGEATAYLHVALTITYALYLANQSMGMALITEAARDPAGIHRYARQALTRMFMLGLPIVAVVIVAAPAILRVFGADYAHGGTTLLRLLAASSLPFAVVVTFMSIVRVHRRMRALLILSAAMSLPALAGIVATVPSSRCRRGRLCVARHPGHRRRHPPGHRAPSPVVAVPRRRAADLGGGATARPDVRDHVVVSTRQQLARCSPPPTAAGPSPRCPCTRTTSPSPCWRPPDAHPSLCYEWPATRPAPAPLLDIVEHSTRSPVSTRSMAGARSCRRSSPPVTIRAVRG